MMDRRLPCHSCEALNGLEWPEIARATALCPASAHNGRLREYACDGMRVCMQMRDTKGRRIHREITISQMIDILSCGSISNRSEIDGRIERFQRARFFHSIVKIAEATEYAGILKVINNKISNLSFIPRKK